MTNKYDVIVVGGGTSGVASAYMAAKLGLKTLIVERNTHLGGTMTSALVTPAMKTNDLGINTEFFNDFISYLKKYGAQFTYSDGNKGWFNPELAKIVFDEMLNDVKCDLLLNTCFKDVSCGNDLGFIVELISEMLSIHIESNYIVDATGDAIVSRVAGCGVLQDNKSKQSTTLRFMMSNVDLMSFNDWIMSIDSDRCVTTSVVSDSSIHLSTAYTWNTDRNWALRPYFQEAIKNGDIEEEDSAYFQIFTVPGMPDSIVFNCPRIILNESEDNIKNATLSLVKGRKQILKLAIFCKKYLRGFENSYISNIADMLGVRESYRVEGKYVYSADDIVSQKRFDNEVLSSDYPIDIHTSSKNADKLVHTKGNYYLPIEALISKKYENLFIIGRCLSATFEAQAALRIQPSCFSMGEGVARYIKSLKN